LELESQSRKMEKHETALSDEKRNLYRQQQENTRLNDLLRVKDEEFNRQAQDYRKNMQNLQNQVNQFRE
jgi:predicted phage gp36 major capsid-like protein